MDRAEISDLRGVPQIELLGPHGERLATRALTTRASCMELAKAAAVVISTWEMELRPGAAQAVRLARPTVAPVPERVQEAPSTAPPPTWGSWLFAGGFVSTAGSGIVPGATIGLDLAHARAPVVLRASLFGMAPAQEALGEGSVRWVRSGAGIGVGYRPVRKRFVLELHGDVAAGLLVSWGAGFDRSTQTADFDPAGWVGLRTGLNLGRSLIFADVSGLGWMRKQRAGVASAGGVTESLELPRVAAMLTLGVGWQP